MAIFLATIQFSWLHIAVILWCCLPNQLHNQGRLQIFKVFNSKEGAATTPTTQNAPFKFKVLSTPRALNCHSHYHTQRTARVGGVALQARQSKPACCCGHQIFAEITTHCNCIGRRCSRNAMPPNIVAMLTHHQPTAAVQPCARHAPLAWRAGTALSGLLLRNRTNLLPGLTRKHVGRQLLHCRICALQQQRRQQQGAG